MPEQNQEPRELGRYFALAQAGMEMAAPIALGAWLDYMFGWSPWAVVTGALLGAIGGMTHLIWMAQHMEDDQTKPKNQS
jgi:F0F1-type ATP synthase assembly protein I